MMMFRLKLRSCIGLPYGHGGYRIVDLALACSKTCLQVILMSEGRLLYHGPTSCLDVYLASQGYVRPSYMDTAAFAIEVVSSPLDAAAQSMSDQASAPPEPEHAGAEPAGLPHPLHKHPSVLPRGTPIRPSLLTVDALADAWAASPWAKAMMTTGPAGLPLAVCIDPPVVTVTAEPVSSSEAGAKAKPAAAAEPLVGGVSLNSAYARQQYGSLFTTGFAAQVRHTTAREMRLAKRNWLYSGARLVNAVGMAIILGLVFFQVKPREEYFLFFSGSLFALTFISFINNAVSAHSAIIAVLS